MNVEAYKVSVRIALEDQITRGMAAMGADILNLDEKVKMLEQSLKHLESSARSAQKALKNIAVGAGDPFTAAKKNADDYAKKLDDIQERSRGASKAISERPVGIPPAVLGGALLISNNAIAERAAMASAHGGGGGRGGGGGLSLIPSPSGNFGHDPLHGWKDGVPPGGWGSGGAGGGGRRGGSSAPEFSSSDAFANLALGYGGFKLLDGFVEEASKYQIATEKFKQFNLGDAALKEAQKFAATQHISGTSEREMMLKLVEAQGVFRKPDLAAAEMAAPVMAKLAYAAQGLDPEKRAATAAKEMDMLRFIETAGGLKSPERFNQLMDAGFRSIQSSGGNIDFTQLRQFMAKGGTAAMGLTDKALFAKLEPIIGELKGGAAGDALMTSYNRLNGIIKLPNQVAHELVKYKVWDGSKITWNSQGGIKSINGNPLISSALFAKSPTDWYEQVMLPIYQKMHLTEDQIHRQNAMIFGRTGSKMFNLIDKQLQSAEGQKSVIHQSADRFEQARHLQATYEAVQKTYAGKQMDLETKWMNFELAMGRDGGLIDLATKGLNLLADSLERVTNFAKEHPEITKLSVGLIATISGLAMLSGGLFVLGHAANTALKTFRLLRWTMELLAGKKELQMAKALTGVSDNALLATRALSVLTRYLGIIGLFVPTNNTPNTTQELAERDRLGQDNLTKNRERWVKEHPGVPFPPELRENQFIRPNPIQPIQVHTDINLDGKPIAKVVTHHQAREAQRSVRSTSSTYDPTMTPPTVAFGR